MWLVLGALNMLGPYPDRFPKAPLAHTVLVPGMLKWALSPRTLHVMGKAENMQGLVGFPVYHPVPKTGSGTEKTEQTAVSEEMRSA